LGSQRYLELFARLTPLIGSHDRDEISLRACELIAEMLGVEACSILLADASRTHLVLAAATHIARAEWGKIELPLGEGICGSVFQTGKPLLVRGSRELRAQFERDPNLRYRTPSFVVVPVTIRGQIAGVINIANPVGRRTFLKRDVDMLEAAANLVAGALVSALQHAETCQLHKNLEDVFDSLAVGILSVNGEGRVTNCNQHARMLFGLNGLAGVQPKLTDILPGTIYNVCRRLMRQSSAGGEPIQERIKAQLEDRPIMLEITISRIRCLGEEAGDSLIMFVDVGQDEEVQRLREAEAMKRNFLSIISHELRTPLSVIRGALPLIDPHQGRAIEGDMLRQIHGLLLKNCHRLNEVVNSILDVTEIESATLQLNLRPVNLSELLDEVIGYHAEGAAAKRLSWDCRFGLDPPEIRADPRRLRQVLSELVANAIKFTNPGGRISIQAGLRAKWVEIEIANTGARIGPALRKTIFEKFCQGSQANTRTEGGCGLGLFLVQNLVRLHGGEVELLERDGEETTFVVRLPRAPAATAQPKAAAR